VSETSEIFAMAAHCPACPQFASGGNYQFIAAGSDGRVTSVYTRRAGFCKAGCRIANTADCGWSEDRFLLDVRPECQRAGGSCKKRCSS